MARYKGDPRWLEARYAGKCAGCGRVISRGETIWYWPIGRKAYCKACGEPQCARFDAEAFDEAQCSGRW